MADSKTHTQPTQLMTIDDAFMDALSAALSKSGMVLLGAGAIDEEDPVAFARFERWLAEGRHGQMGFLENHHHIRKDPSLLLDEANIAIIVALPYYHQNNTIAFEPLDLGSEGSEGSSDTEAEGSQVARYSLLRDYHRQIPKKVKAALAEIAAARKEGPWHFRVVTDSAPILERAVAERHSRGFIGKNTLFIHPQKGSFLLLGEIIAKGELRLSSATGKEVDPKKRSTDGGCGSCSRCQTYCPTDALSSAYTLDATKCLSYWSIEHRGAVPYRFWRHFDRYLFGCDICQTTCPYNRATKSASVLNTKSESTESKDSRQLPLGLELRSLPSAGQLVTMNQKEYEQWFGGIAMTRAKITGLRRNGLLALAAAASTSPQARLRSVKSLRALAESIAEDGAKSKAELPNELAKEPPKNVLVESAMAAAFWTARS